MDTSTARAVSSRLADLLSREHVAMADFLVALADFDRRKLWEPLGYPGLWMYLYRELRLSKGTASYRVVAARLVGRFPEVEAALRDGRLCITSVVELAKVLTPENQAEVLPRFFHCSRSEAQAVAVSICPKEVVPQREVVTALPVQPVELVMPVAPPPSASHASPTPTPTPTPTPVPRPTVEHLTADRSRLHVTVSRRFLEKLQTAKDALSHARPGADVVAILEAGLDLILAQQAKRRGQVAKPRKPKAGVAPAAESSDGIPAEIRRAVWARGQGCCQWRLDSGDICGSTHRLELDHIVLKSRGGPSTVANLRILCERHNKLAARLVLGERWMGRYLGTAKDRAAGEARGDASRAPSP